MELFTPAQLTHSTPTTLILPFTTTPTTTPTQQQPQPQPQPPLAQQERQQERQHVTPSWEPPDTDGKVPHIWTTHQKGKLLELILEQTAAGHATENGNMKKEGWMAVVTGLNSHFNLDLNREQIKNQKNVLRALYLDYKFLSEQPGFLWCPEKSKVVSDDPRNWAPLIDAHPRRNLSKIKDRPFPIYDLADRVFAVSPVHARTHPTQDHPTTTTTTATATTTTTPSQLAANGTPATHDHSGPRLLRASTTSSHQKGKRKESQRKRGVADSSFSEDDHSSLANPSPTDPTDSAHSSAFSRSQRPRKTQALVVAKSMDRLTNAITHAATSLQYASRPPPPPPCDGHDNDPRTAASASTTSPSSSIATQAFSFLAAICLGEVDDELYLRFILLLEDLAMAATFVSLAQTSSKKICRLWLDRKVRGP